MIDDSQIIIQDTNRCIRCHRCVSMCENIQSIGALKTDGDGFNAVVFPAEEKGLSATKLCELWTMYRSLPHRGLRAQDDTDRVFAALADPDKFVVAQTAPSVRFALGEAFDFLLALMLKGGWQQHCGSWDLTKYLTPNSARI